MNENEFLIELCSGDLPIIELVSSLPQIADQTCNLLIAACENEDVYVGNFFEEVVPQYSDSSYKKHFRMSRNSMDVSRDCLHDLSFKKFGFL